MKTISVHSFRRGTGKTMLTANTAVSLACSGFRVGMIDLHVAAPGLHLPFAFTEMRHTLNDFVWGNCEIEEAAHELRNVAASVLGRGELFLVPADPAERQIARMAHGGYYLNFLGDACTRLIEALSLDFLLLDNGAGITEETQTAMALADELMIILRPDRQDYLGTGIMLDLAQKLAVSAIKLIVNEVPPAFDNEAVAREVARTYGHGVTAVLPHNEQLAVLGSQGVFVQQYPHHPLSRLLHHAAAAIIM